MKKWLFAFMLVGIIGNNQAMAVSSTMLICEAQTGSATSSSEEYVKLCNNSPQTVDVNGWRLQYFASTATSFDTPTRNVQLTGSVGPFGSYIIASSGYMTDVARSSYGATLAAAGGHLRLVDSSNATATQYDLFGWGTAKTPETKPADTVPIGEVYKRKNSNGVYIDTDNNYQDFGKEVAVITVNPPPVTDVQLQGFSVIITELLPDPPSPQTDAEGEYVELYNPSPTPALLKGYKLQSGSNNTYSFTFGDEAIAPGQYKAYYVATTKLSLSNSGGKARLVSSDGGVVNETAEYNKAPAGESWSLIDGVWSWTKALTPSAPNAGPQPNATSVSGATSTSGTAAKKTATKTSTTKSVKSNTDTKTNDNPASAASATAKSAMPVHPAILAIVGVGTVGYIVYEYRQDIASKIIRIRRNRAHRR